MGVSPCGRGSSGSESWRGDKLMQEKQSPLLMLLAPGCHDLGGMKDGA